MMRQTLPRYTKHNYYLNSTTDLQAINCVCVCVCWRSGTISGDCRGETKLPQTIRMELPVSTKSVPFPFPPYQKLFDSLFCQNRTFPFSHNSLFRQMLWINTGFIIVFLTTLLTIILILYVNYNMMSDMYILYIIILKHNSNTRLTSLIWRKRESNKLWFGGNRTCLNSYVYFEIEKS